MNLLIETNIPMPTRQKRDSNLDIIVDQLMAMNLGDSFLIDKKDYQKILMCTSRLRHKYPQIKVEFKSIKEGENNRRFWRIK